MDADFRCLNRGFSRITRIYADFKSLISTRLMDRWTLSGGITFSEPWRMPNQRYECHLGIRRIIFFRIGEDAEFETIEWLCDSNKYYLTSLQFFGMLIT